MSDPFGSSSSSAPGCTRGLRLLRYDQEQVPVAGTIGYRFRVHCVDACDLSDAIFVYLQHPYDPATGGEAASFTAIASPIDLETLPIGQPNLGQVPPLFRLSIVDLVVESETAAQAIWDEIISEVTILINALNIMDQLVPSQSVVIGGPLG